MTEKDIEQEQKAIDAGRQLRTLLGEPVMQEASRRLIEGYFHDFRNAKSQDVALDTWQKVQVFDDLLNEFTKVLDAGVRASADRANREKQEAAKAKRPR